MPLAESAKIEQNPALDLSHPRVKRGTARGTGEKQPKRYSFDGIQVLRAVAALFVVAMHGTADWTHLVYGRDVESHIWFVGNSGVDIFFIISGLVMAVSTYGRTDGKPLQNPRAGLDFMVRRLVRIVPLYWLFLSLRVVKTVLQEKHIAFTHAPFLPMSVGYVVQSYLFIPAYDFLHRNYPPIPVGWTLCFEMFFYLLLAITLTARWRADRFLVPLMITLSVPGLFYNNSWPAVLTLLHGTLLLEFLAGLLLGLWIVRGNRIPQKTALICGAIAMVVLLSAPFDVNYKPFRGLWWGTLAFAIVAGTLALEKHLAGRWPRSLVFLGNASYSIYLSHFVFMEAVRGELEHLHLTQLGDFSRVHELLYTLIFVAVAAIGGILCYILIERPTNNFLRKLLLSPRAAALVIKTA